MVRPTTARPCCCRRAATAEESTPPDMATATSPRWVSARSGRVSNWTAAFMLIRLYRPGVLTLRHSGRSMLRPECRNVSTPGRYNRISMNAAVQFDTLPERAETQRGLVAVAMSGGVDSSAVAALLQQQGRAVVGLTMQLWNQRRLPELQGDAPAHHRCCSLDDVYDAKRVAQHLNFPHYVVNFEHQFEDRVVRPFVQDYLSGRTPIACTNCNTDVKFEPLLRMARQIGADRLATGHYARIRRDESAGCFQLLRALDATKDQSYFLWGLSQEQLSRSEFPLGELSKDQVREIARRATLPVAEKPDSMELCFVPSGNYVHFIQ